MRPRLHFPSPYLFSVLPPPGFFFRWGFRQKSSDVSLFFRLFCFLFFLSASFFERKREILFHGLSLTLLFLTGNFNSLFSTCTEMVILLSFSLSNFLVHFRYWRGATDCAVPTVRPIISG